jgi:hypothetical protein
MAIKDWFSWSFSKQPAGDKPGNARRDTQDAPEAVDHNSEQHYENVAPEDVAPRRFDPRANVDAEIRWLGEDRLDRADFARRVAERIAAAGDRNSIVYGLAGPWGGGKTSVLNMIAEALMLTNENEWKVVRFTPWSASDTFAITDEFYRAIAEAMPESTKEGRYARYLLAAAPVAAAATKAALTSFLESKFGEGAVGDTLKAGAGAFADKTGEIRGPDPDPFVLRFKKMSSAIEAVGTKVLVIVDDIDRLDTTELLSVMRAVRLLGRFKHVHYLLSYDEATVIEVLKQTDLARESDRRAYHYLEKIIQYPFVLPPLDPAYLESELFEGLDQVANLQGIVTQPDGENQRGTISSIIDKLPQSDFRRMTLRGIYRFVSQVDTLLTLVGSDELDFEDAALITFLRLRHSAVYDVIPRWRSEIVGALPEVILMSSREPGRDEWLARINKVLPKEVADVDARAELAAQLGRVLAAMFPRLHSLGSVTAVQRQKSISASDYFDRYFAYKIPVNDVSDSRIRREFEELTTSGELPEGSIIAKNVHSFLGRGLVLRKILYHLDLVREATSTQAIAAADHLLEILDSSDLDRGGWTRVIRPLLIEAIASAASEEEARGYVDGIAEKHGLLATANILVRDRRNPPSEALDAKIRNASFSVREDVLRACERDLSTDVQKDDASALTVLHFVFYLDDELFRRLGEYARSLIANGQAQPYELAARFVVIRVWRGGSSDVEGHLQYFAQLVPISDWAMDSLPPYSLEDVVDGDTSLENRKRLAVALMRQSASELGGNE